MLWPGSSSQTPLLGPPRDVSPERGRPRLGPKQTLNGLDLESLQLLGMAAAELQPTTEALDLSGVAPRIQVPRRAVEEISSRPGFFPPKVCNSPELFRECVCAGGRKIPGSLGLHPHSAPRQQHLRGKGKSPEVQENPGREELGASGILPSGHESVSTPALISPDLGFFPRKELTSREAQHSETPSRGWLPGPGVRDPAARC